MCLGGESIGLKLPLIQKWLSVQADELQLVKDE